MLGSDSPGIRDLDADTGICLAAPVDADGLDLLGEGRAFQAIAEAVRDLAVVVPLARRGGLAGGGAGRVALAEHAVKVAGLVVFITGVDALQLREIPVGAERVVAALIDLGGVGEHIDAVVLRSGRERSVHGKGVGQVAGGKHLAAQELGDAVGAVGAGIADPDDAVNGGVPLELVDLHGGGGVEQHHDLAEALTLDPIDKLAFFIGQGQNVAGGAVGEFGRIAQAVQSGIEAGGLSRVTPKDDDGGVLVALEGCGAVLAHRYLADGRALALIAVDHVAAGGTGGGVIGLHVLVKLQHGRVDGEAVGFHGLAQRDHIGSFDQLAHGAAELHLRAAAHTEERHLRAAQRGLALERNAALRRETGIQVDLRLNELRGCGIVGLITIVGRIAAAGDGRLIDAQQLVDLTGPAVCHAADGAENHQQCQKDPGDAAQDVAACLFHRMHPLLR